MARVAENVQSYGWREAFAEVNLDLSTKCHEATLTCGSRGGTYLPVRRFIL
jgi:hypothetical protein